MTDTKSILCRKCGAVCETRDLIIAEIVLPNKGSHHKASCPACKSFIKFMPYGVPTFYFGKYKGETVSEVAQKDPSYLEWFLAQGVWNLRLRTAIEEALCRK